MRNYSSRKKVLADPSGFDTVINTAACNFTGREYNRVLSKYIIDDLLDALSAEDATEFMQYSGVLVFIMNGMFSSSSAYLKTLTVSDSLKTTLAWLIDALSNSDSIGED